MGWGGSLGGIANTLVNPVAAYNVVTNPVNTIQGQVGDVVNTIKNPAGAFQDFSNAIGNATGTSNPAGGPTAAPILQGTDLGQTGQSYFDNQQSLASQQRLLAALSNQNGLGAQTQALGSQQGLLGQQGGLNSVGSQANALMGQQQLNNQLSYANGVGNQAQALSAQQQLARQQQGVANQYQGIVNGTGPNPAMAALNQTTGQNVANQSALMAGQRGASSNVGLLARQAAQQGAATQQQAVGQGATMQANQSLNALSGLSGQQQAIGNTQQNVANIAGQQVGQQQTGVNAQQQAASNLVGQQQAQQQALAGQANTLAGQQLGQMNQNVQQQQSEQQLLQNSLAQYNQQNVAMQGNINTANAGVNVAALQGKQGLVGGLLNGAGAVAGAAIAAAKGGMIEKPKKMANGGAAGNNTQSSTNLITDPVASSAPSVTQPAVAIPNPETIGQPQGPQSSLGQALKAGIQKAFAPADNQQNGVFNMASNQNYGAQALQKGITGLGSAIADQMSKGGMAKKHDYRGGGNVKAHTPAQKAVKAGNSYSNDKIPAVLSEHEIVLPRDVTLSKDPVRAAGEFVAKVLAKRKMRKSA